MNWSSFVGQARRKKKMIKKLTILAVGDDDQNIYRFRGANVQFIRKFKDDYKAGHPLPCRKITGRVII